MQKESQIQKPIIRGSDFIEMYKNGVCGYNVCGYNFAVVADT